MLLLLNHLKNLSFKINNSSNYLFLLSKYNQQVTIYINGSHPNMLRFVIPLVQPISSLKEVRVMEYAHMVHVRAYWRFRLNRWEFVRKHLRHYPSR